MVHPEWPVQRNYIELGMISGSLSPNSISRLKSKANTDKNLLPMHNRTQGKKSENVANLRT